MKKLNRAISIIMALIMIACSFSVVFAESEATEQQLLPEENVQVELPNEGEPQPCEHVWGKWIIDEEAGYFHEGSKHRDCANCEEKDVRAIAKKTAKKKWVTEDGNKYYFGAYAHPVTGWHKIKISNKRKAAVKWCYFNESGVFIKSIKKTTRKAWVTVDGKTFRFSASRKPLGAGMHSISSKYYYFDQNKVLVKGSSISAGGIVFDADENGVVSKLDYYRFKYKTFVCVDISDQKCRYYQSGEIASEYNVITGKQGHRTPKGAYKIKNKLKKVYLTGPGYRKLVYYWMGFIGYMYGFHDATWRDDTDFDSILTFEENGSLGCVNMRLEDVKELYDKVVIGTRVLIQQ